MKIGILYMKKKKKTYTLIHTKFMVNDIRLNSHDSKKSLYHLSKRT